MIALVSRGFVVVGREYGGKGGEVEVRGVRGIRERVGGGGVGRRRWSRWSRTRRPAAVPYGFNGILHLTTIFSKKIILLFSKGCGLNINTRNFLRVKRKALPRQVRKSLT